ncbi:thioesterase family protein [Pectinatus cerevisiiphilus]|uniref:Putative thioesterase n=1 Tax=Pectinatus cerevisiiphilus TaxID=86956 RepID=A0A4R3K8N4_9FIRM|nr:thioesterase [Pectinatus cerevisiiphilus]TCS79238.1 putative thioesterase [Pectinatus cerevisiiphilus]
MFDVSKLLTVGQNSMLRKVVQRSDTAASYSKDLNRFLSTTAVIDMAIRASMDTIDKYLPDGFVSIGFTMKFTHTAATSLGMSVTVKASIINIEDHEVDLRIDAWDEQGEIGHGLHKRSIVSRKHLYENAEHRTRFLSNQRIDENK